MIGPIGMAFGAVGAPAGDSGEAAVGVDGDGGTAFGSLLAGALGDGDAAEAGDGALVRLVSPEALIDGEGDGAAADGDQEDELDGRAAESLAAALWPRLLGLVHRPVDAGAVALRAATEGVGTVGAEVGIAVADDRAAAAALAALGTVADGGESPDGANGATADASRTSMAELIDQLEALAADEAAPAVVGDGADEDGDRAIASLLARARNDAVRATETGEAPEVGPTVDVDAASGAGGRVDALAAADRGGGPTEVGEAGPPVDAGDGGDADVLVEPDGPPPVTAGGAAGDEGGLSGDGSADDGTGEDRAATVRTDGAGGPSRREPVELGSRRPAAVPAPLAVGDTGRAAPATAPAAPVPTERHGPIVPHRIPEVVAEATIRAASGPGSARLEIRVDPPDLGPLHIEIQVDGDRVELLVRADHGRSAEAITQRRPDIVRMLAENGFEMTGFDVSQQQRERSGDGDSGSGGRHVDDGEPTFEVPAADGVRTRGGDLRL